MFFVYILECADGSFYVGQTSDLAQRVKAHDDGTAANFTRERRPVRLAYAENLPSRESAVRRERQLKGWTHAKKRALIHRDVDQLRKLSRSRSNMSR
jgi:predicted GIY-YIG superfamily endonuclease